MKIGFFTDSYLPRIDGVATTVDACAEELEKMGHEVYIIAPSYPGYKDKRNVFRILSIKVNDHPETRMGFQVPQPSLFKIMRINFDIIHGHSGGPITFLGWQVAQLKNIPYVATYHTFWNRYAHYFLFLHGSIGPKVLEITSALFGNICDATIAPTEKVKDELGQYGIKKPIFTIPSGLILDHWGKAKKGYLHQKYKIKNTDKILLTVCRLGKEKSVSFLLESFALLYKKYTNLYYVIVGDGPEKMMLIEEAKHLGISDRVIFTGAVPHKQIAKVYVDADIFLYASQTETQGMVIVEAMASGVPVVAVDDRVFDGVIQNNVNGYLVKGTSAQYAEKVEQLLLNSSLRREFVKKAKETVHAYSVTNTAKNLLGMYHQVIQKHASLKTSWKDIVSTLNTDIVDLIKVSNPTFSRAQLNLKELTRIKDVIRNYLNV